MATFKGKMRGLLVATTLVLSQLSVTTGAMAQTSGVSLTLAASEPTSYDHKTGGGNWNLGRENIDIRKSLEGENFVCNDIVSYLTNITVPNTDEFKSLGQMTFDLNYGISMDTTGLSGVALGEPVTAVVNSSDTATVGNKNSSASITSTSQSGEMFAKGAELFKTVRVTGVEAGETIILRVNVKIHCQPNTLPSGNLQFRLRSGDLVFKNGATEVVPAQSLNVGEQTISLKNVSAFVAPSITISKTVTTSTGSCPGNESITIEPTQYVKFCYEISNASSTGDKIVGPLFNVSKIHDDNGIYPDFDVTIASGLTDVDKDGVADDLAAGATAYASYVTAFDGNQDSIVTNIATVTGYGAANGGTPASYSASDTATTYIDAPAPDLTISKLTNGSDSSTILVGTAITWTYYVTNTGDRALHNIYVVDNQGVTVNCPYTELAISASMTCSATGVAVAGNYANTGTVYGTWDSTQVSASDSSSYFGANPAIDIQKTPDTQTVVEGQKAAFTITVTNTGNVDLTGVVVSDVVSSECAKSIGALAVAAQSSYTCNSAAVSNNFTNVASVVGYFGTKQVSDDDDANVIVDYLPNIEVTKSANPLSVLETGETVTFTFAIKNKAPENFILTSMVDDKFGNLDGKGSCVLPETITAGSTYSCTLQVFLSSDSLTAHINLLSVEGHDPEGHPGSGSDDATVTFTDVLPSMSLTKSANPTQVVESGGNVTYTFVVTNKSKETLFVTSLVDDKLGDLNGKGSCIAPQTIAGLGSYTCAVTQWVGNWTTTPLHNIAVANGEDNEGNKTSASDSATVTFTDLLPTISLTKTVNPTIIRSTGEYVDYTIKISNTGPETVTVDTVTDTSIILSADCLNLVGQVIPIGGYVQCTIHLLMYVSPGSSFTNTAGAVASDNEGNHASASGSAVLKTYWYGRTPGYWKNHSEAWKSGYLPTQYVQDIFTIPSGLLSGTILDLDGNKSKDTLIAGLGYKGGSTLSGAAQILLRASIAALLNEAYYGADYPAETSVSALIAHVNSVLATQNRDSYLALATEYDKWNNGVEGPLP